MRSDADADRRWLADIRDNILLARDFLHDMGYTDFANDPKTVYSVTRCLEIVSEATRRLSSALKARHLGIPWSNIAGAGNVYRHAYQTVTTAEIWDTAVNHLPILLHSVDIELANKE